MAPYLMALNFFPILFHPHITDQSAITIKNIKPTVILVLIADWSVIFRMKLKFFLVTSGVTDARRHTKVGYCRVPGCRPVSLVPLGCSGVTHRSLTTYGARRRLTARGVISDMHHNGPP